MIRKIILSCLALLILGVGLLYLGRFSWYRIHHDLPPFTREEGSVRKVLVVMRDGVKLATEVHLPSPRGTDAVPLPSNQPEQRFPLVLIRNPYDMKPVLRMTCGVLVRYGYGCIMQDVRGRLESEGLWEPLANEGNDGKDTLKWLRAQTFSDGNIALLGQSYLGATQWLVADDLPPEVKTIIPFVFGTDVYSGVYERGLFRPEVITAWATLMPDRETHMADGEKYLQAASHLPAADADQVVLGKTLPWYREWLSSEDPSAPLWNTGPLSHAPSIPSRVNVPVLMVSGWFDPFLASQVSTHTTLKSRAQSVWVIGPWNHLGLVADPLSVTNAPGGTNKWPLVLEWLDHHLKGVPLKTAQPGTIQRYVLGKNDWAVTTTFDDPKHVEVTFHLGDAPTSQTCVGGKLSAMKQPDSNTNFVYDPAQPNPSLGGASLLAFAFYPFHAVTPGPAEQGKSCERADVLTFRSAPLVNPLLLSSANRLELSVSSTAPDTSFVARLIEESADGSSVRLIREAAATLSLPTSRASTKLQYAPKERVQIELDFWPIDWELPSGSRLRVDVSSSSFPALALHSNTAVHWNEAKERVPATQTIYTDGSRLVVKTIGGQKYE